MSWEDILKRKGRKVTRPDSKRSEGRPMSRFTEEDADRARRARTTITESRKKDLREAMEAREKMLEEYRNSPSGKKTQKYGTVYCRDCGLTYYPDENFKDKCDGGDSLTSTYTGKEGGCGAEGHNKFGIVEMGENDDIKRYIRGG